MKRALSFILAASMLLGLAASMLLGLAACNRRATGFADYEEFPLSWPDEYPADQSDGPVTLSEYLTEEERIWFWIPNGNQSVTKDEWGMICVTYPYPTGSLYISLKRHELGEIAQMSDDEIITLVMDEANEEDRYPYEDYKLNIVTDGTGNNTAMEEIWFAYMSLEREDAWEIELMYDCGTYEIYQSKYSGFVTRTGGFFLTRVYDDVQFTLDPVGTEGVLVDDKISNDEDFSYFF